MSVDPIDAARKRSAPAPHFVKAARYSYGGFRRLLLERAFREELACFVAILALFAFVGAGLESTLVQIVLFLVLASVEALNTAIEVLVDRVSPEISRFAEHA